MGKIKHAAWLPVLCVAMAAAGCNGLPRLRRPTDPVEAAALGQRPGPMKQLANSVSESSFGQSVSKVFRLASTRKPKPPSSDPISLATKVKPITADDYVMLGTTLEQNGDIEKAREAFHKALELQPHHLGALLNLGRLFDRQGQLGRATEHYVEATKYHPKDATAFNDLAWCFARQGKYAPAVAALQHAVELKPDSILYRNNIAKILVAQGRNDEALAHLIDAHGPAVAHYNLGFLLNEQGRHQLAAEQFQLALAASPPPEVEQSAREWIDILASPPGPTGGQGNPAQLADAPPAQETPRISRRPTMPKREAAEPAGGGQTAPNAPRETEQPAADGASETAPPANRGSSRRRTASRQSPADTAAEPSSASTLAPDDLQPLPPVDASSAHPNRY